MLEGRGPDLSDRRLSRPTSASFMTARLGNAALVIALALALGIAGDLTLAATAWTPCLPTPTSRPSPHRHHRLARDLRDSRDCGARERGAEPPSARLHGGRAVYAPLARGSLYSWYHLVPVRCSLGLA